MLVLVLRLKLMLMLMLVPMLVLKLKLKLPVPQPEPHSNFSIFNKPIPFGKLVEEQHHKGEINVDLKLVFRK